MRRECVGLIQATLRTKNKHIGKSLLFDNICKYEKSSVQCFKDVRDSAPASGRQKKSSCLSKEFPGDSMAGSGYSLTDYLQMPITWIVILLVIIIVQLVYKRPCINVHLAGGSANPRLYRDVLATERTS